MGHRVSLRDNFVRLVLITILAALRGHWLGDGHVISSGGASQSDHDSVAGKWAAEEETTHSQAQQHIHRLCQIIYAFSINFFFLGNGRVLSKKF